MIIFLIYSIAIKKITYGQKHIFPIDYYYKRNVEHKL